MNTLGLAFHEDSLGLDQMNQFASLLQKTTEKNYARSSYNVMEALVIAELVPDLTAGDREGERGFSQIHRHHNWLQSTNHSAQTACAE